MKRGARPCPSDGGAGFACGQAAQALNPAGKQGIGPDRGSRSGGARRKRELKKLKAWIEKGNRLILFQGAHRGMTKTCKPAGKGGKPKARKRIPAQSFHAGLWHEEGKIEHSGGRGRSLTLGGPQGSGPIIGGGNQGVPGGRKVPPGVGQGSPARDWEPGPGGLGPPTWGKRPGERRKGTPIGQKRGGGLKNKGKPGERNTLALRSRKARGPKKKPWGKGLTRVPDEKPRGFGAPRFFGGGRENRGGRVFF